MEHTQKESRTLLILGMHRSGTSYISSVLQNANVFIGDQLIGPGKGNPYGHFESLELVEFHKELLNNNKQKDFRLFDDGMMCETAPVIDFSEQDFHKAKTILNKFSESQANYWGWKDPRTCLFLDFWKQLIPNFNAIIVYRHPLEIFYSTLRRGHWDIIFKPEQILNATNVYNQCLINACQNNTAKFIILNANTAFKNQKQMLSLLNEKFGLNFEKKSPEFIAESFQELNITNKAHSFFSKLYPSVAKGFDDLQTTSNIPYHFYNDTDIDKQVDQLEQLFLSIKKTNNTDNEYLSRQICAILLNILTPDKESLNNAYSQLTQDVCQNIQDIKTWNDSVGKSWNSQVAQLNEFKLLYEKSSENEKRIWEDLQNVGKSWVTQRDYIINIEAEMKQLKEEIAYLKQK